jgi:putative CocE/NonD family hydrolase
MRIVLLLACTLPAMRGRASSQEPAELIYVTTLADAQIAREVVVLAENGWTSEVALDMPGQKVTFEATLERGAGSRLGWRVVVEGEGAPVIEASYDEGSVELEIQPHGVKRSFELKGDAEEAVPFFFENLMWACFHEVARRFVPLAEKGELGAETRMTGILAQHLKELGVTVASFEREAGLGWRFELRLEGGTEVSMLCDAEGLPTRFEVPSQALVVTLEGREVATSSEGRSVVDRGPWRAKLSQPTHEVVHEAGLRVPMRDGVELAADVYRPAGAGKFPAILIRTPYNRKNEGLGSGQRFAKRGYALCVQDVRGRFESAGIFQPLRQETADGSDTLDWLAAQEWCDGKIGMIGGSYAGLVQWLAAKSENPHLKAIVPQVSPPDPQENFPYEGGVFMLGAAWWAKVLTTMDSNGGAGLPEGVDWATLLATLPLAKIDDALGAPYPWFEEWLTHPPTDEEYWEPASYQDRIPEIDVPALHVTGWFDGDQPGALQNFPRMRREAKSEHARNGQFLIAGPWGHGFNATTRLGDVDFGSEALIDLRSIELRFFDRYLKGVENGIEEEDPVWVFVMEENRWRREETWPPQDMRETALYLGSDGDAHERDGDGKLDLAAGAGGSAGADEYRYDPADLPEVPDEVWNDVTGQFATMDMATLPDREDALDYTSAPLAAPVELTGPFRAVLWTSSSAADTDYVVAISRLDPSGRLLRIAGGIQRVRYRDGKDEPAAPGEIVRVEVDGWASSIRLRAKDRLHVEVTSTAFPGYARNLGTLEPIASGETIVVATNRILHDAEHPSHVLLPVVPREGAPGLAFER